MTQVCAQMTTRCTLTTEQYVALTRATDKVLFPAGMKGVQEIGAQDIPALLNFITNGAFKFYWSSHFLSRAHITFERLDDDGKFAEMRAMLASNKELANFLRWHMKMTDGVWEWNLPREESL